MNTIDYKIRCLKCSREHDIPSYSPREMLWSYRAIGSFDLPGKASGAYCVALTLRFFAQPTQYSITPIMSFNANKGAIKIEADLGLLLKKQRVIGVSKTVEIFAECKTYNQFTKDDINRMKIIAKEFPRAVLVFSTLRKSLEDKEKTLLRHLVNKGRRLRKEGKHYNPLMILTGKELLLPNHPPQCWKDSSLPNEMHSWMERDGGTIYALCECTQQLHLGVKSWCEWNDEKHANSRQ